MSDNTARLLEAQRALERLHMQIEQYQIHLDALTGQPHEAEKVRAVLDKLTIDLERQHTYCRLLETALVAEEVPASNGSARVA